MKCCKLTSQAERTADEMAIAITLRRPGRSLQGSIGENDTFGTQQHAPLLNVEFP